MIRAQQEMGLYDAYPFGNIDETEALIKGKAEPKTTTQNCGGVSGSAVPNNTYGYGIANAYEVITARLHLLQNAK